MAKGGDALARSPCAPRALPDADSRLRSVFLQHRLIAGMAEVPAVHRTLAKFALEQIVDRLLAVPGGLEPLMLLQRDEALLARSTAVAVLTVVLARHAGWPEDRLSDLGSAALLRDLGLVLDESMPGRAGFGWLLGQGCDDFWLRCAMVARHARGDAGAIGDAEGACAVVGLAAAIAELPEVDARADLRGALRRSRMASGLPASLVDLACRVFAG